MDAVLAARVERIAADELHGSSWLAREAVAAVVEAAQREDPLALARELVRARPDVGSIAGALGRVLVAGRTTEQLVEEADALISSGSRRDNRGTSAGRAGGARRDDPLRLGDRPRGSRPRRPRPRRLHGLEPGGEGRAFAEELAAAGLTTEVEADDDAEHAVGTVQVLLLGADTVFQDGSLLNKVGTSLLTKAARKAKVPVLVASEILKIAPADPRRPNEERVDLTPPSRITRYATEEGIFEPGDIAALVDRTPFLAEGYEPQ